MRRTLGITVVRVSTTLAAAALTLAACSSKKPAGQDSAVPDARRPDVSLPDMFVADAPPPPAAPVIPHLVVIVQENHTFDNYFGSWCTAPAGSNPTCNDGPGCCEAAPAMEKLARKIVAAELSVRRVEELVRRARSEAKPSAAAAPVTARRPSISARDLSMRLTRALGTRVEVVEVGRERGQIAIHYHSLDQLDALLERLLPA